jgi:hypothetical protein
MSLEDWHFIEDAIGSCTPVNFISAKLLANLSYPLYFCQKEAMDGSV